MVEYIRTTVEIEADIRKMLVDFCLAHKVALKEVVNRILSDAMRLGDVDLEGISRLRSGRPLRIQR